MVNSGAKCVEQNRRSKTEAGHDLVSSYPLTRAGLILLQKTISCFPNMVLWFVLSMWQFTVEYLLSCALIYLQYAANSRKQITVYYVDIISLRSSNKMQVGKIVS